MSKQVKQAVAATLSTTALSAIAATFADALTKRDTSGSLVTHVCDAAQKYAKGAAISDEDRSSIVANIASIKGWSGASAKSRMSECNVVLKAYAKLPEAITSLIKQNKGKCQWHDSMKLARKLNEGATVSAAVTFVMEKGSGSDVTPKARAAGALKAWLKHKDCTKAEKAAITQCVTLLRIDTSGWGL